MGFPVIDLWPMALIALGLAVLGLTMRWWRVEEPFVFVSQADDYAAEAVGWRVRWRGLPTHLMIAALCLFGLAFANPRIPVYESSDPEVPKMIPTRGLAFYLLVDRSGSMRQNAAGVFTDEGLPLSKISLLKQVSQAFIKQRPNDLLGLVAFARTADIVAPLTLDHAALLQALDRLDLVRSNAEDGTGIGYAIFKTVSSIVSTKHFGRQLEADGRPAYTIDHVVIILLTDGFQSPNPLDTGDWMRTMPMEDAAAFAKAQDIKVYLINIEPKIRDDEFTPHRNLLKRIAQSTGGDFFIAENADLLQDVFRKIESMEKNTLPIEVELIETDRPKTRFIYLYPFFLLLGLVLLGVALILYTTILRRVP